MKKEEKSKDMVMLEGLLHLNVMLRNGLNPQKDEKLIQQYNWQIQRVIQQKNKIDRTEQPYYGA